MAPKKKAGKKAQDDWEADLGEDQIAQAETAANGDEPANEDKGESMGGGLLATIKKNRGKKAKKGKPVEDFVEGEDPTLDGADTTTQPDLTAKAPREATFDDDEEDIYSGPIKKANNSKGGQADKVEEPKDDDEERDASGRVMTKKEKEKAKKEREKQRKKEQVCCILHYQNIHH
jgi:translation initiation factor 5B